MRIVFEAIQLGETRALIFDFSSLLATGETISSATTSCALYTGTDASPSSVIVGSASILAANVTQKVSGLVVGNIYILTCHASTSAGQTLILSGYLTVIPATS